MLQQSLYFQVFTGQNFSVAISDNGQLFTWGDNHTGQLGLSSAEKVDKLIKVPK